MYVFDTNVVIYYLRDDPKSTAIVEGILVQESPVYVSTVTEAELFAFPNLTEKEIEGIDSILSTLSIIPLDSHLARLTGFIRRTYRLKIPDSIIAATALFMDSILVTKDGRDFSKVKQLKLLEF